MQVRARGLELGLIMDRSASHFQLVLDLGGGSKALHSHDNRGVSQLAVSMAIRVASSIHNETLEGLL